MSKMTLDEKIAQTEALLEKYKAEKAAQAAQSNVSIGDTVRFRFGRGDTKRELVGTVLGDKTDSGGRWLKVQAGEGFDAETFKVHASNVIELIANAAGESLAELADMTKAEARFAAPSLTQVDPLDPLAAQ